MDPVACRGHGVFFSRRRRWDPLPDRIAFGRDRLDLRCKRRRDGADPDRRVQHFICGDLMGSALLRGDDHLSLHECADRSLFGGIVVAPSLRQRSLRGQNRTPFAPRDHRNGWLDRRRDVCFLLDPACARECPAWGQYTVGDDQFFGFIPAVSAQSVLRACLCRE